MTINKLVKIILLFPFLVKREIGSLFLKKMVLSFGDPICCPSVTINKKMLSDFRFSEKLTCILDWQAWYQLAQEEGTFIYIHKRLMQHRVHGESETSNQILLGKRRAEEKWMLERIWGQNIGRLIAWVYQLGQLENKS